MGDYYDLVPAEAIQAADECKGTTAEKIAAALRAWQGAYTVPMGYPATDIVLPLKKSEAA